jgi:CDP-glucose 4,6-dehydratase
MLQLAIDAWGSGEYQIDQEVNQPHEAGLLKLDITKVKSELKWVPKVNAQQTVQLTIDWYRTFISNNYEMNNFTEHQILSFIS